MNTKQIEAMDSIRLLCRSGVAQTGEAMHYTESHANGWTHVSVNVFPEDGELITWHAGISPAGNDTPPNLNVINSRYMTLRDMQQRLTDYIASHRKQEVA